MRRLSNGKVVLTAEEYRDLCQAFGTLYTILTDMPAFMGDMMSREEYIQVGRASAVVGEHEFSLEDWTGESEDGADELAKE